MKIRNGMSWKEASLIAGEKRRRKKEERAKEYNKNPKKCLLCKKFISYDKRINKFCSRSCAATYNNFGRPRNFKEDTLDEHLIEKNNRKNYCNKLCKYCGKETDNITFCSMECYSNFIKSKRRKEIDKNRYLNNYRYDKWYLEEIRGKKCEICENDKWMDKDIPLDVHHIDGDSDNNNLDNLKLICPNCHRQTKTYGGKNKENGRHTKRKRYRKYRYDNGLSY